MRTVEYRMQGTAMMVAVALLPLFCAGYGALVVGRMISKRLQKERRRRYCEKVRGQRERQRLALREARKNEQRGERWNALRHAKAALSSASPLAPPSNATNSVLKNNVFENTDDARCKERVPTGEEVARQWDRTHDSVGEMVRFGLMLLEIEGVTDNSVIMGENKDGERVIVGRNPGVRGWLAMNCPHISYKTAMRYKSLARKALQAKKGEAIVGKNETVHALQESLYAALGIEHYGLENPRAKRTGTGRSGGRTRRRRSDTTTRRPSHQSLVFATRSRTHDALLALSAPEARSLGAAFQSLANEVRGAS